MTKCNSSSGTGGDRKDSPKSKEAQAELTAKIKFKSQVAGLRTEFSQLKKQFKTQCKAMQLFDGQSSSGSASSGSIKNRKAKGNLQNLSDESSSLDKTIQMTQQIISQGSSAQ